MTASLLEHLQEQGYDPDPDGAWFDLTVTGTGSVRVNLDGYQGDDVRVYGFDRYMACEWQVTFSDGTPNAVILAVITAAEDELAAKRGGPVTPAQVANQ